LKRLQLPLLILCFLLMIDLVSAENLIRSGFGPKHRTQVGFKAGIITQTDFNSVPKVDSLKESIDRTKVGLSFQLSFDAPVGPWLLTSLSFGVHDIQVVAKRFMMLDIGIALKYPIYKEANKLAWRPTIGIGWGYLGDGEFLDQSSFTTGKIGLEGVFYSNRRYAYTGEMMLYGSLSGGNDDYRVTFGPTFLLRLGVLY